MAGQVKVVSDGINDTWLELDGERLNLPIKSVNFSHYAGSLPVANVELECIVTDALVNLDETTIEVARTLIDRGARVRA